MILSENPKGRLEFINDELLITSLRHEGRTDAAAIRLRSENQPVIGKIAWDDGQGRERFILTGDLGDGIKFQGNPSGETTDAAMRRLMAVHWDGVRYDVPIIGGSGGADRSTLRSPRGRYDFEMQDDGVMVCYDEHDGHRPLWKITRSGEVVRLT